MIKSINAKALIKDQTFNEAIAELKDYHTKRFINSQLDDKINRENAYMSIRALDEIVSHLQSRANDEKFNKP